MREESTHDRLLSRDDSLTTIADGPTAAERELGGLGTGFGRAQVARPHPPSPMSRSLATLALHSTVKLCKVACTLQNTEYPQPRDHRLRTVHRPQAARVRESVCGVLLKG